jgi:hypothetical protein
MSCMRLNARLDASYHGPPHPFTDARVGEDLVFLRSVRRLVVTASVVPSSPILVILMKEALSSSETLVLKEPHDVTSQKTPFFIITAVKTSNLTQVKTVRQTSSVRL